MTDDGTRKSEKFDASRTSYVIRELAAGAAYHVRLKSSSFVGQSPFTEFIDAAVLSPGNNNYYSVNVVATVFFICSSFFLSSLSIYSHMLFIKKTRIRAVHNNDDEDDNDYRAYSNRAVQFCPVQEAECAVQDAKVCSLLLKRQIIKNLVTRCQILKCTDSILARVLSQTPIGELIVLLRPPSWIQWAYFYRKGVDGKNIVQF